MAAGGLVLGKSADIEMRSEDLYISRERVRVAYTFYNRSARPIRTRIAFPLPELDLELAQQQDVAFPRDFETLVDGAPVTMAVERRAFRNGVEVTRLLGELGVPLVEPEGQDSPGLRGVPAAARARLEREGLAEVERLASGPIVYPLWRVRETWHWTQTFPARSTLRIEHGYVPGVGGTVGVPLLYSDYRGSDGGRAEIARYCVDRAFLAALDRMAARQEERGPLVEHRIGYILSTGANWAGPIRDFRLVVDKGRPDAIVSFCGTGLRRISPTRFEMRRRNFTPTRDPSILIVGHPYPDTRDLP